MYAYENPTPEFSVCNVDVMHVHDTHIMWIEYFIQVFDV